MHSNMLECFSYTYLQGGGGRMADYFGLKIGVEGEKEFKKAFADINSQFKVLGSEMKLVTSQFDKYESSVESLASKIEALTKQIDALKEKF